MNQLRTPMPVAVQSAPPSGTHRSAPRSMDEKSPFRLRVMHESLGHIEILSSAERLVVGREPPADFCLDHPSVGQPHCEIVAEAAGFVLNDFGSKGGTRVGSVRIRSAYL